MNKLEIFKGISEIVVSIGVGSIVGNAIKLTTDPEAGKLKRVAIGIGGFVISNMVGDMATKYTGERIDDAASRISKLFAPLDLDEDGEKSEPEIVFPDDAFVEKMPDLTVKINDTKE